MVSRDDENRTQVTATVPESAVAMLDGAVDDAPDWLALSRSELLSYAVERGLEDAEDDVLDLIPPELLARYKVKRRDERTQAEYYVIDKREGWRGRVKSRLNARLAGEHPYTPEGVRLLARGYRQELEYLHRLAPASSRSLEDDDRWLDRVLDEYAEAHHAKQIVPDSRPFEGVEDKIALGRDLEALRGELRSLVADLSSAAEGAAFDPDAVIRAKAQQYGVSEEAVETVLDQLVPDEQDARAALKGMDGHSVDPSDVFPEDAVARVADADPVDTRGLDGAVDELDGAVADDVLEVSLDDLPTEGDEQDADEVARVVQETIRADGGDADD